MKVLALTLALLGTGITSAWSAEYNEFQPASSSVDFAYEQMGVSMEGHFNRLAGSVSFDPTKPENARADLDVDLTSIDTGSPENDEEVIGKNWFDTASFPKAHFKLESLTPKGGNNFDVIGKLSIKNITREIVAPATFKERGSTGVFDGTFVMKRADYAIGQGEWSSFDVVANDIKIKVRITATAK